jgi:pyruvate dehydrogenase E2 component (dihydrolipoamide acetyltransferase)
MDRIKVPIQAIWGAEDRIVPPAHASVIPEGHRHVLGGAGHMVHMEKAGEVNRLISDFLTIR